jgi:hypothetical protein
MPNNINTEATAIFFARVIRGSPRDEDGEKFPQEGQLRQEAQGGG